MNDISTIERLPEESNRAFAARIEYVTMGPDRSLDKTRQRLGKSAGYTRQLQEWSTRYGWASTAAGWDNQQAAVALRIASEKYRADLEKHRSEASEAGHALYVVAGQLIRSINEILGRPKKIKGEDGKIYTVHNIDLNANTFSIAARAMQTALDLKAHALNVDKLLPSLASEDEE